MQVKNKRKIKNFEELWEKYELERLVIEIANTRINDLIKHFNEEIQSKLNSIITNKIRTDNLLKISKQVLEIESKNDRMKMQR